MTLFEIIILAIIQGITEFLPISSSAHLILPAELLGWQNGLAFDVAVHVGSLLAVMIYFREDIVRMLVAWFSNGFTRQQTQDSRLAWWVILATLPIVLVGYLGKELLEVYARNITFIAVSTIVFGLLLWYADKRATLHKDVGQITWKSALAIGLAQILALIPGTSRSGITITAGLMLGLNREAAARFSFLLSIPTIMGSGVLVTKDLVEAEQAVNWTAMALGAGLSFVSAYTCIYLFLAWISRLGMTPFVIYRLVLGFALLGYVFFF